MGKRRGSGRATITDVAEHAGVGAITVSRMMRDPSKVSEKLRSRIEKSIRELQYIPDPKARALASGRADVIGVLIPSLSNIIFADTLRAIHDSTQNTPYQVLIGNTRYDAEEENHLLSLFLAQNPAALIVVGIDQSDNSIKLLQEANIPVVQIYEIGQNPIDMSVGLSHIAAGEAMVEHLLDQGFSKIGYLAARLDPRMERRLEAYRKKLKSLESFDPKRVILTNKASSVNIGRELMRQLIGCAPDTDAVICANDDIALGALFECQAQGISVPEQMGIIGFNDLEMMQAAYPSLTSIRTDRYKIGTLAVDKILQRLNGDETDQKQIDTGFELIQRDSTSRR
ncbi:transcriptional regulator [Kiloniella litopenaei]|uniref:Transcriptional regulator n=1 Tax=Kiloniella litopenaei TaxID=1549748 RepID=A0A0M2RAX5_9PROT|nr:LacI family DNA-binding transcriptional regulator [Kiloniella litopenaei]KKJ78796.1 transcriptional regulator [Kiloniella litopenaei]